jgi:hypothetical protein
LLFHRGCPCGANEFLFTFTPSIRYIALTILLINRTTNAFALRASVGQPEFTYPDIVRITNMKCLTIAIAMVGATATASAFAQSNVSATPQAAPAAQVASNSAMAAEQAGQWVPSYGQATAGKTRAQVYQELVHAEQDGQLDYLNSTLYAH